MSDAVAQEPVLAKAFEEVVRRNVTATVDHANATRKMFRDLEEEVQTLKRMVETQNGLIQNQQKQIGILQGKLLRGGPTGGDQH